MANNLCLDAGAVPAESTIYGLEIVSIGMREVAKEDIGYFINGIEYANDNYIDEGMALAA